MNWRKVSAIARTEYLVHVRRPSFLAITLIVPALGLAILGLMAFMILRPADIDRWMKEQLSQDQRSRTTRWLMEVSEEGRKPIGIVDQSGLFHPILPEYQESFIRYDHRDRAEADLRDGKLVAVLVIEPDYLKTGRVVALTRDEFWAIFITSSIRVVDFLRAHLLNRSVDQTTQQRVLHPIDQTEQYVLTRTGSTRVVKLTATSVILHFFGPSIVTFIIPYLMTLLLVTTIFTASGYLLNSMAQEKENRLIEILLSSVRPMELVIGKVIGLGALGFTRMLVWLVSAWWCSGGVIILMSTLMGMGGVANIPLRVLMLDIVYYLFGYALYAMLMVAIGAVITGTRESEQVVLVLCSIATLPDIIVALLVINSNVAIARVLSMFPLTAPTMMMLRLALGDVPWVDIVASLGILFVSILAAAWLGARMVRVGLLIYEKRPTMQEIWQMIRTP